MEPSVTQYSDDIFTIENFLSVDECTELIKQTELVGYESAPISTPSGMVHNTDVRNNTRVMYEDPAAALELWGKAKPLIPEKIGKWAAKGLNERLRFYRYNKGQYFNWHFDGSFERHKLERSFLTFMVYLNDDFEGGETCFKSPDIQIRPEVGTALVFHHPILHIGSEVSEGTKYVLRSDVMYRIIY